MIILLEVAAIVRRQSHSSLHREFIQRYHIDLQDSINALLSLKYYLKKLYYLLYYILLFILFYFIIYYIIYYIISY